MNDEIKEILQALKESYDKTIPKQEFNRYLKYIEDYITDLQADNQELQDSITWWNNRYNALQRDYEDYKSRCEKAIEYIEDVMELTKECPQDLLNILNGKEW